MGPVIERIADQRGHNRRVSTEFLIIRRVPGDIFFVDPGAADGSPFVVVAAQPQLGQIRVLFVLRDVLRRYMAVVVDDRELFGIGVIEDLCRLRVQKKVLSHKGLHRFVRPFIS